jgi:hypothetical protein
MKSIMAAGLGLVLLAGGGYLYRQQIVPPSCADPSTIALAKAKLAAQFRYPDDIALANIRTLAGGVFSHRSECQAEIQNDILQTVAEPVRYTSELTDDTQRQYVEVTPLTTAPPTLPVVSCDADGQVGFLAGPKEVKNVPPVSDWARRYLAYYATESMGVLAPRGWSCFSTYGSNGSSLFVAEKVLKSDDFFKSDTSLTGPAIQLSLSDADTSGRFSVARTIARLFPNEGDFVRRVIDEKLEPASDFPFGPYPTDKIVKKNEFVVEFETPAHAEGMGTHSLLAKDDMSISGVAMLLKDGAAVMTIKLPPRLRSLTPELMERAEWMERDNLMTEGGEP